MKRKIYFILLILWMIVIFYFSNQNGNISMNQSNRVVSDGVIKVVEIFNKSIDKNTIYYSLVAPIRKYAHFAEFFVLGLLSFLYINTFKINVNKKIIYAIMLCLLYAAFDELHQFFIPYRNANAKDVLIDFLGSFFSIMMCFIYYKIKIKKVYNSN